MHRARSTNSEWLGATYMLSGNLDDGTASGAVIWLELPRNKIVMLETFYDDNPGDFGQSLVATMTDPEEGRPRRPSRVRVSTEEMARSVRIATEGSIEVVVAPVPELDLVFDGFQKSLDEARPSYVMHGEISPDSVSTLFKSAVVLYDAAPWRFAVEEQIIRIDIPELGVDGACLEVIGSHDESFGILLFRSCEASIWLIRSYDETMKKPPQDGAGQAEPLMRSLSFEPKRDLPPSLLEEIQQFGWPVAGPKAYPIIFAIDQETDGMPLTERDVRIMSATATALVAFTTLHRSMFAEDDPPTTREVFRCDDGTIVAVTAPYIYIPKPGPRKARKRKPAG